MDKYEYKVRADEIKELIAQGDYAQAAEIADTIDWRRVKSVMMLCTISDLYKINRRYEDAKDLLLLAYERRPGGRTICYSLCELSIKTEDFVRAVEYYKEYVQVAPKDPGRYILQYKLYEAQDVSLEERIEVLEELKKKDYREKWAYELAYLYHRIGLATRCVEECDELILWFGEGKYVIKAMELKMLHEALTPAQQEKYDNRYGAPVQEVAAENETAAENVYEEQPTPVAETQEDFGMTKIYGAPLVPEELWNDNAKDELDIQVKTLDVNNQYNTINLQAELAAGLREVLDEDGRNTANEAITRNIMAPMLEDDTESLDYPEIDEVDEEDLEAEVELEHSEVFFGETEDMGDILPEEFYDQAGLLVAEEEPADVADIVEEKMALEELFPEMEPVQEEITAERVMDEFRKESHREAEQKAILAQPPKEMAQVLAQESDGQISLVVPGDQNVEKQITGQMNIEEVLAEWERMKRANAQKNENELRKQVLEQTGELFAEFDAAARDGLLEKLQKGEKIEPDSIEGYVVVEDTQEETSLDEGSVEYEELAAEEEMESEETAAEMTASEEVVSEEVEPEEIEEEDIFEVEEIAEIEEVSETEEILAEEEDSFEMEELVAIPEETVPEEKEPLFIQETLEEEEDEETEDEEEEASEEIVSEEAVMEEGEEEQPTQSAQPEPEVDFVPARDLTKEERILFAPYIQTKKAKAELANVLDGISMAAYTGNVIITGGEGVDTLTLAKNIVREIKQNDSNFSGKVAKVSGQSLNRKDVAETITQLEGGALIILSAAEMNRETADALYRVLQQEQIGIVVFLEDMKSPMNKFLAQNAKLKECFTARMDVEALSNDALVAYAKKYAQEKEYSISALGALALHTRIEDMQTLSHAVTVTEVKGLVDEAIRHSKRKTVGHFFDVLLAKRYDEDDMIILGEKDFY